MSEESKSVRIDKCPNCNGRMKKTYKELMGEKCWTYWCYDCGERFKLVSINYLQELEGSDNDNGDSDD